MCPALGAPLVCVIAGQGAVPCLASPGVGSTLMHISLIVRAVSLGVGSTLVCTDLLRAFGQSGFDSGVEQVGAAAAAAPMVGAAAAAALTCGSSGYSVEDGCICLMCRPRRGV